MEQPLEILDFSGGVTDYYLGAPPSKLKTCDNLLLQKYPGQAKPFIRPGSQLYDAANPQIPAGAQRISTCFDFKDTIFVQSSKKQYYYAAGWQTLAGPTGNDAYNSADTAKIFTYAAWNSHMLVAHDGMWYPQKIVKTGASSWILREAGLPKFASAGVTFTPAAGANTWLYVFVYRYDYTDIDGVTYSDYGTPSDARTVTAAALPNVLTTIPVLANGATDNFAAATIKVEIYRTTTLGTVYYYVGEVTNGTVTYTDNTADGSLTANALLYTEGGVVANDRPPKCRLVHVLGDLAYYGDIIDASGERMRNRVQQAIPGDIDAAPASFYLDVDDELIGMSSTKSSLVLLGKHFTYRVDGAFDEVGRGGMVSERISDRAGCVSAQSVVQTLDGVFWAGFEGIFFTDGFQVVKLNGDYDKTWKEFVTDTSTGLADTTKQKRIQGKYDRQNNRIWWTIQHESADDVDKCYVLDLNWGIRENATFTTVSGLTSFSPTAIEFDAVGNLIRCDRRGYVLYHKPTYYTDPKIDTGVTPSSWVKQTIFYDLESAGFNFGTSFARKFVPSATVVISSDTNVSLQLTSNNDDQRVTSDLSPIYYRGGAVWGDEDIYWGDPAIVWGQQGLIQERRRMPARSLRCDYKQLQFTNAKAVIVTSDLLGTVEINATTKTATLTNAATLDWPTNSVDYYLAFEQDGYEKEYLVSGRTADVLTFVDTLGSVVAASASKFELRGYPKGEQFNLISYSLNYAIMGKTQGVYNTSDRGGIGD